MKRLQSKLTIKILFAFSLSFGIAANQWPLTSRVVAAAPLNLKSESQIKSEASLYDTALREIERIGSLKLSQPENSKAAQDILNRHTPNLRFIRSKLIALGLSDSSFVNAVKAKAQDKKSAEQFAHELATDINSIYKLSGASAIRDKIKSSVTLDIAKLQKIAQSLNDAEADHSGVQRTKLVQLATTLAAVTVAVVIVSVAMVVAVFTLGSALVAVAAGVAVAGATVAVVSAAGGLVAAVVATAGTDQAQDKVASCTEKANSKKKSCRSKANELPYPASVFALDKCDAEWLLNVGACFVTE